MALKDCFNFKPHEVISIIGSGGKTTLMNYLADCYRFQRVLMTTTTKIFVPQPSEYDRMITVKEIQKGVQTGINVLGVATKTKMGIKLTSIELSELNQYVDVFDKTFIEADGAHRRILKAWRPGEPVFISKTTQTLAILPMNSCGLPITDVYVHRLPLFLKYGDFQEGAEITPSVLAAVIEHPNGLLAHTKGQAILVLNHITNDKMFRQAKEVVEHLSPKALQGWQRIIAANTITQWGEILWDRK